MLRIRLIGGVSVDADGQALSPPASRRAWALLAWLAAHPGMHARADVAAKLWPDVLDTSARQSMRSALWSLRQTLDDADVELLVTSRDAVGIAPTVEVDLARFEELLAVDQLADAVEVGDGELLAGIEDEWALVLRDTHRERLIDAFGRLCATSDSASAVRWARRASALDPMSEDAARTLMQALAVSDDRPAALAVYQRLADRLRRELRVAPSEPTWRLAEEIRTGAAASSAPVHAPPAKRRSALPLVGRRHELDALKVAWDAAAGGAGGLVLVHGDAGIGKTRLVAELIDVVRRTGGVAAVGAPPDLVNEPLTAWIEICRELVTGLGDVPDAAWVDFLAPLLPTLIRPTARTSATPDVAQARLAEAVVALLELCARAAPLLVVLEDMHTADEASLAVLAHVARRVADRRILLLVSRRERPLRDHLAAVEQAHSQRGTLRADIALGPLDERAVSRLVRAMGSLTDDAISQVIGAADGNALIAVEVARSLAAGDPLPLGLRGSTRAAMARLPEPSRELVKTLAVAGRDLDRAEAIARAEVDLAVALPAAEDQGLLQSSGERIAFRHALLREAVYADMPSVERAERHDRAAALLSVDASHDRAAEAAAHLQAAGHPSAAGQLLVHAAARARELGALADATTLLEGATAALPADAAAAIELADVLAWRGRSSDAQVAFERALPLIEAGGSPAAVAAAHLRFAEWHYGPICQPSVAVSACRRSLAVLDGAGLPAYELRARILSVYAWCEAIAGSPEEIARVVGALTALVGTEPTDPLQAAELARTKAFALLRQGKFTEAVPVAMRSAELSTSIGRPDLTYTALVNAAFGLAASGDMQRALDLLDQTTAALAGHGMLAIEALVLVYRAWVLVRLDRIPEAAEAAAQARRAADRLDTPSLQAVVDAERGRVALRAGEYQAAAGLLLAALSVPDASIGRPLARLQRAEALARQGCLDDAEAELAEVVFEPVREGDWPETLVIRMSAVEGLIAAGRGDVQAARSRMQSAVQGWRRLTPVDLAERIASVMADLGRPIIGLILPAEELAQVEADLAQLDTVAEV